MNASTTTTSFKEEDRVTYANHGVGTIGGLITETIADIEQQFYEFFPDSQNGRILVPVQKASDLLQPVDMEWDMAPVIAVLREPYKKAGGPWHAQRNKLAKLLKQDDPCSLAAVVHATHPRGEEARTGLHQFYQTALYRLVSLVKERLEHHDVAQTTAYLSEQVGLDFAPDDAQQNRAVSTGFNGNWSDAKKSAPVVPTEVVTPKTASPPTPKRPAAKKATAKKSVGVKSKPAVAAAKKTKPSHGDVQALRRQLAEVERDKEQLAAENDRLRREMAEKDGALERMREQATGHANRAKVANAKLVAAEQALQANTKARQQSEREASAAAKALKELQSTVQHLEASANSQPATVSTEELQTIQERADLLRTELSAANRALGQSRRTVKRLNGVIQQLKEEKKQLRLTKRRIMGEIGGVRDEIFKKINQLDAKLFPPK
jgi:RNA polymerase-interacting CarD/CdnL/TRCF family regulator/predicted  nucleic acid-binding Zn-ribbon protein